MSGLEKVFAFELYLLNFESLRKRHRDTVEKMLKKTRVIHYLHGFTLLTLLIIIYNR